ncbi:hypothetical protein [Chelatococcus reniformis]|uniref:Uncharacterized protein n=1 Tax=Chelatococcus reniformis TaxID=1494448 RepID=A0A916U2L5_9HYPH|nr:hypothetical protein [Chelatococcus reniformis]GGC54613.1 hypothetical protein GCM10010994_11940 [Chelatococcus reniformis]
MQDLTEHIRAAEAAAEAAPAPRPEPALVDVMAELAALREQLTAIAALLDRQTIAPAPRKTQDDARVHGPMPGARNG